MWKFYIFCNIESYHSGLEEILWNTNIFFFSSYVIGFYKFINPIMDNQNIFLNVFMEVESFFGSSVVKNPPERQEAWVQSLSQEDPLEEEMATQL